MGWHDTLTLLGLKLPDLFAGFAGGVVSVFLMRKVTPWEAVGSIVAGAFTANFFGESAAIMINVKVPLACFAVGLTSMAVCQGLVEMVKSRVRGYTATAHSNLPEGEESGKESP